MQEIKGLVSVIIPVYNGENYLQETIDSVTGQTYTNWEIIVVNDGSVDGTQQIVERQTDPRIRSKKQANAGVSTARNNGLLDSNGEYIVFFDGDDLMTPLFIEARVNILNESRETGFVGGSVETFPQKSPLRKAAAQNPEKEILFFDPGYATVPSNYLFRKAILITKNIRFNILLGSTADRFFVLQVARVSTGKNLDNEDAKLLYRINPYSMSHRISPALILDNERFYKELEKKNMLPVNNKTEFKSLYFYSLAAGFIKVRYIREFLYYLGRSFFSSPLYFAKAIGKRAARAFEK